MSSSSSDDDDGVSPAAAAARRRRTADRHLADLGKHSKPPADIDDPDVDRWPRLAAQSARSIQYSDVGSPGVLMELACDKEDDYPSDVVRNQRVTLPQLAWNKT